MFKQINKTIMGLLLGLSVAFAGMQTAQAAGSDLVSYESTSMCAAMFIASAKILENEPDKEAYNELVNTADILVKAALRLAPEGEEKASDEIVLMTTAVMDMTADEYSQFIDEFGPICIDVSVQL